MSNNKKMVDLPKGLDNWLIAEQKHFNSYQDFLNKLLTIPEDNKTVTWLEFIANEQESFGDEEALIYLISRGYKCEKKISQLVDLWKLAEQRVIKRLAAGNKITDFKTGTTKTVGKMSISAASKIKDLSSFQLRNFWGYRDQQEFSIDATMLRMVEWGKIGGFNDWWDRLAKEIYENIIQGGINSVPASFWLFNMCRSELSIKLNRKALERTLESLFIPEHNGGYPWSFYYDVNNNKSSEFQLLDHIPFACSIVFANYKLSGINDENQRIISAALDLLLRSQNKNGGWECWKGVTLPDIQTTAMAIHALCVSKPLGWERAVGKAKDWLLSMKTEYGFWSDRSSPDDVFLTVLVLDSIDLANGKNELTFFLNNSKENRELKGNKRFAIALSFPGEYRYLVEKISNKLVLQLGKDKIFYDKNFEEELARPNLDIYLQNIYLKESELIVIFLCKEYMKKEWCGLEWRTIRELIKQKKDEEIFLLKIDAVEIPGVLSIDGYIDISKKTPANIAKSILLRLSLNRNKKLL